jgi:hypothetical protein
MAMIAVGCSGKTNPVSSDSSADGVQDTTRDIPGHNLAGIWEMQIDPDTLEAQIVPTRDLSGHMNITGFVKPLGIHVNSLNPTTRIMNVDITINNPTSYTGYDVRLILFTNDQGLKLTNDDGWTDLYDLPGGSIQNPFKAFEKDVANRLFSGSSSDTENLLIYWPSPTGAIQFAVDVSFPSNCVEPYEFVNFTQIDNLGSDHGAEAEVRVEVRDWQYDLSNVNISAEQITGLYFTPFTLYSGDTWTATIVNNESAPVGQYECMLAASSGGYYLYDYVTVQITPGGTCPADDNNLCTNASQIGLNEIVSGCVDGTDSEDWYELTGPPNGVSGGTITLTHLSGTVYMMVYDLNDGGICPGTMYEFADTVTLTANTDGKYLIRVFSDGYIGTYRLTTNVTPIMTNFPAEIYVAVSGGHWPIYEKTGPDIELTVPILTQMMGYANNFWNQYGYNLVWDGTVTTMSAQYYVLNNGDESYQMNNSYGRGTGKISLYFVDQLDAGNTAYCVPGYPKSNHTDDNVYTVYSPNVWYWENVIAHEEGHEIGYLVDQYLYEMAGCACGNNSCLGAWQGYSVYLYSDPTACYYGNLMMASVDGWGWEQYDLTYGQHQYVNWFHNTYPNNFAKY